MPYEGVHFRSFDMPAVSAEHPLPWLANTLQTADAALLVVDLCEPACVEQLADVHATLREKGITLTERWSASDNTVRNEEVSDDDPFAMRLPTLMLANKSDRVSGPEPELAALCELAQLHYSTMTISPPPGTGSVSSAHGSSANSASCASTRKRRTGRPIAGRRSRCTAARRCATSHDWCTRTWSNQCDSRAFGVIRDSTVSRWDPIIRWLTATWSNCIAKIQPAQRPPSLTGETIIGLIDPSGRIAAVTAPHVS
jgi:hypothetical protein